MAYLTKQDELWQTLASIAADEGLELYDAEKPSPLCLRIVADKAKQARAEGENTQSASEPPHEYVSSGDCTRLCRRLMHFFAVEGTRFGLGEEPDIDVSSPGVNRTLRLEEHYEKAVGQRIKIVFTPVENGNGKHKKTSTVIGMLERAENGTIQVVEEQGGKSYEVPRESIIRARVEFKF